MMGVCLARKTTRSREKIYNSYRNASPCRTLRYFFPVILYKYKNDMYYYYYHHREFCRTRPPFLTRQRKQRAWVTSPVRYPLFTPSACFRGALGIINARDSIIWSGKLPHHREEKKKNSRDNVIMYIAIRNFFFSRATMILPLRGAIADDSP